MTLERTFYSLGIVFMSVMLILIAFLVIEVFIIHAKITAFHKQIDEKINHFTDLLTSSGKAVGSVSSSIAKAWSNHKRKN